MSSSSSTIKSSNININERESDSEELGLLMACQIASCSVLPMALKAALDLDLFEIMAKAGPNVYLSPLEISSQLGTDQNPDAPAMLGRILRLLTAFSILRCSSTRTIELLNKDDQQQADQDGQVDDDQTTRLFYGLGPVCKYFTRNEDGVSLAPLALLIQDKVAMDSWYHLKDVVMEGGIPFNRAHGMSVFEYPGIDLRFNKVFSKAMSGHTTLSMKKVLETYKGFEDLKELVDVGGGVGVAINLITSKYPKIKGINFDLPHVLADAPSYPGVEHVRGDMFESVPRGEAIFMKWILHNWSDEHCLKLLKNCFEALPNSGKVIIVDSIVPVVVDTSVDSRFIFQLDLLMLTQIPGGKERTFKEFEALAKQSGFARCETICTVYHCSVMEFHKTAKI